MLVMAKVVLENVWPDGQHLKICVRAETPYPDALDQAKRTALDAFTESVAVIECARADEAAE